MKARFSDRLRRISEKKRTNLLKRADKEKGPDFIVFDKEEDGPKSLVECQPELAFYLLNGEKISSIHELGEHIEKMDEHVFKHHVNADKNDFSSWVGAVFNEEKLASDLKKSKTKEEHHAKVLKHVVKDLKNYIQ